MLFQWGSQNPAIKYEQRVVPSLEQCQYIQQLFMKRGAKENVVHPKPGNSKLVVQFKPPKLRHFTNKGARVIAVEEKCTVIRNILSESKK